MILCSGYNVYPRRVEDAIYEHPAVQEVTVIGIPDEYRGEAPKAFIKLRDGQHATAADIMTFLVPKLSKIEMPSQIEFRDELPKTMIGKLSKKELRAGK
jgi:long-chain acyl-CoA synthetase